MLDRCDVLPRPEYQVGDELDALCPEPFKVSAVVSNARPAQVDRDQCLRHRFSIIFSFRGTNEWTIEPTRAEHIASADSAPPHTAPT